MTTKEIADKLVKYCRQSKWADAHNELYAADAVSIEPHATPGFSKETKGLPAINEKGRKFDAMIEKMHSMTVSEPLIAGDSFVCTMQLDCTMKGQGRVNMAELCLYQVKDGKIVSEEFRM